MKLFKRINLKKILISLVLCSASQSFAFEKLEEEKGVLNRASIKQHGCVDIGADDVIPVVSNSVDSMIGQSKSWLPLWTTMLKLPSIPTSIFIWPSEISNKTMVETAEQEDDNDFIVIDEIYTNKNQNVITTSTQQENFFQKQKPVNISDHELNPLELSLLSKLTEKVSDIAVDSKEQKQALFLDLDNVSSIPFVHSIAGKNYSNLTSRNADLSKREGGQLLILLR